MSQPPKYSQPEIERRWLVPNAALPRLEGTTYRKIEDKYLDEGRLRLRRVSNSETIWKLGKKYPSETGQPEPVVTIYLSEAEFEALNSLPGIGATKTRHAIADGSLDVYDSPKLDFAIFEAEFSSAEEAKRYVPPNFVTDEITGTPEFSGYRLAGARTHTSDAPPDPRAGSECPDGRS